MDDVLFSAAVVADSESGLRLSRTAAVARWRSPAGLGFVAAVPLILMGRRIFNVVAAASRSDAWVLDLIELYFGLLAVTVVIGLLLTVVQMFLRNRRVMAYASPGAVMTVRYLRDSLEVELVTGTTVIAYDRIRDFFAIGGTVYLRARGTHGITLPRRLFPEQALRLMGRQFDGDGTGCRRAIVLGSAAVVAVLLATSGLLFRNFHDSNAVAATPVLRNSFPIEDGTDTAVVYADIAYLARWDGVVQFIDARTGQATAAIPVVGNAAGVALDPAARKLYVASGRSDGSDSRINVIDIDTKAVTTTIPFTEQIWRLAIDTAAHRLYAVEIGFRLISDPRDAIRIIDTTSNTVIGGVTVPMEARDLAIDPTTHALYVGFERRTPIHVIDPVSMTVKSTIPFGARVRGLALDPTTSTLYAIGDENSLADEFRYLKTIDTETGALRSTLPLSPSAWAITVDTTDHTVYTIEQTYAKTDPTGTKGLVRVLDSRTGTGTTSIVFATGSEAGGITTLALDPITHRVYAIDNHKIHVITR
ncbi:YncE family protein [Nocardia yamanashiensis]|uniref:YncE family protein n=1 Tax=Nocardia yamanashiensis TaxID=209247 RepID=UPI001E5BB7AB|nr:YncE family protein [Nocardia yamanashiensis]UGT39533.1 YncE family protein [Nocardia yamanashiensis]